MRFTSVPQRLPDLQIKRIGMVLDEIDETGIFSGYASLFGTPDLGHDVIERGAFARSLRTRGTGGVRMLFQHDPSQVIGSWTEIREDERGLFVRGKLSIGIAKARELHLLMKQGALDGLSIGFRAVKARKEAASGLRRIIEADLWEISVVTFPMLPGARIGDVKAARHNLPTIREFERWLTQDAGLSRTDARSIIAKGFAELKRERDAAIGVGQTGLSGLAGMLRRGAMMFHS